MILERDTLQHYGILRRSGRYPWGSGGTQNVRNKTFLDVIENLRKQGLSDAQIAEGFSTPEHPISSKTIRAAKTIALNQQKRARIDQAQKLKDKGYSNVAIGKRMGLPESSVRALLAPGEKDKVDILTSTADMLKRQVDEKGMIDVGHGVHLDLPNLPDNTGISKGKFDVAVAMLQEQGYKVHYVPIRQQTTGKDTNVKVLTKPDVTWGDVARNKSQIKLITEHSEDGGRTWQSNFRPPTSISSKRVQVRYKEDGGDKEDGMIYIRPGAKDLDLGKSRYAQVRIAVDGTHYIKGMAAYKDDLPAGTDIVFNTNKARTKNKLDALKPLEADPSNPFKSSIKRQSGHLNIVNEEGDWDSWSRNLSSQMLSKQSPALAKQQLAMTYERRKNQFDEIMSLTNPSVRKMLLDKFADETDSAAVHLKAAALPRTANKVILPVNSVKPHQVYAPSFRNGERVVLVRHPHGGTFELPELTVNNRNPEARKILGTNAPDAIAIHHSVASRLSGADFDGDTVLAISNVGRSVKTTPALEGLKDFDPQTYKRDPSIGVPKITPQTMQTQMGVVSNLITDMTIKGAGPDDLSRAIRHSMVVIDSEKHDLDYRKSAVDHGIQQLKNKYQKEPGSNRAGASTLISRARSDLRVPELKLRPASEGGPIDPATGRKVYVPTGRTRRDKQGREVPKIQRFDRLALETDAHRLKSGPSGTRIEHVYADHSNQLKSLANQARKETLRIQPIRKSPSAEKTYAKEVASLNAQLNLSKKNAPLERNAQRLADQVASQKIRSRPDLDNDEKRKIRSQTLEEMRVRTGAKKYQIELTQSEWDAIQAGAFSPSKLNEILNASKLETVKKLATPRTAKLMTSSKTARAKAMLAAGFTQQEVADHLGVSLTTLKDSL